MDIDTTQLIYFSTVTSIIFWVIVLWFIYYFICKKQFNDKVKQLEGTWTNRKEEYTKDYKQREQYKENMFDSYLKKHLKKICFDCKVFDEKADDDNFCIVEGECPGIDLMKSQKILVMREKDSWLQTIRRE